MITDRLLQIAEGFDIGALSASQLVGDVIDMGVIRSFGAGAPLRAVFHCTETVAGTTPQFSWAIIHGDVATTITDFTILSRTCTFGDATQVQGYNGILPGVEADEATTLGPWHELALSVGPFHATSATYHRRYLGILFFHSAATLSAGIFDIWITTDIGHQGPIYPAGALT